MMEPRGPHKVFVYGTLLPGEPNAPLLGGFNYTVAGTLYDNGGFPFAILRAGPNVIRGAVCSFAPKDMEAVLARLDRLEGYFGPGERNLYDRVEVTTGSGAWAWVYEVALLRRGTVMHRLPRIPGGNWVARRKLVATF